MSKIRSVSVWAVEMLFEATGTALWMGALAFIDASPGARNDLSFRVIFGISAAVLIEFGLTGYLITTLISALYLQKKQGIYPLISSVLYMIHSEIFFVGAGNKLLDNQNLSIQIGGACIAFALTLIGNRLRAFARMAKTLRPGFETSI